MDRVVLDERVIGQERADGEALAELTARGVALDGDVAVPPFPDWAMTDDALRSAARLVRDYHSAVAGLSLPPDLQWSEDGVPDPNGGPIICHNDVCPENVVVGDGEAVALLDFDFAAPGRPLWEGMAEPVAGRSPGRHALGVGAGCVMHIPGAEGTPAAELPPEFAGVPWVGDRYPGAPGVAGIAEGANCQLYAYTVLAHFGLHVPSVRSSERWTDHRLATVGGDEQPLELVLYGPSADPYGAHVGVVVGENAVLHLCAELNHPAVWTEQDWRPRGGPPASAPQLRARPVVIEG